MYGHYKEKMNLTREKLQETKNKLDNFRDMIRSLSNKKQTSTYSTNIIEGLIYSLTRDFEEHLNDDLDVKGAFESLLKIVEKLSFIKKEGRLKQEDSQLIIQKLRKIDEVFQVIFS